MLHPHLLRTRSSFSRLAALACIALACIALTACAEDDLLNSENGAFPGPAGQDGAPPTGDPTPDGSDPHQGDDDTSGPTAGTSGMGEGAGGGEPDTDTDVDSEDPPAPAQVRPRCLQKPSQVVLLGDSYINWVSHTFPADLNSEAGSTFRMYAVGAYSMGSGGVGFIPPQLDQAVADDPDITTIVMTGGGNDVLVPDTVQFPQGGECRMRTDSPSIPDCQAIVARGIEAADEMMHQGIANLAAERIDVVYFFYPNVPEGTLVGGAHPNAILEYAVPMVKDFCDSTFERSNGKITCHFVDMRPVFEGHPEYFFPLDIHPNPEGSAAMAKEVWQTMVDNCVAQPASSGCCEP